VPSSSGATTGESIRGVDHAAHGDAPGLGSAGRLGVAIGLALGSGAAGRFSAAAGCASAPIEANGG